jgi:hypothetical protein
VKLRKPSGIYYGNSGANTGLSSGPSKINPSSGFNSGVGFGLGQQKVRAHNGHNSNKRPKFGPKSARVGATYQAIVPLEAFSDAPSSDSVLVQVPLFVRFIMIICGIMMALIVDAYFVFTLHPYGRSL